MVSRGAMGVFVFVLSLISFIKHYDSFKIEFNHSPSMTGLDYFFSAFTTDYANFSDRARRSEFWYYLLFNRLILLALISLAFFYMPEDNWILAFVPLLVFYLVSIIPTAAVSVRRLHDTGHSGWLYLLFLVPSIGSIAAIIFGCIDGKPRTNKWGLDPKRNERFGHFRDDYSDNLIDDDLV